MQGQQKVVYLQPTVNDVVNAPIGIASITNGLLAASWGPLTNYWGALAPYAPFRLWIQSNSPYTV